MPAAPEAALAPADAVLPAATSEDALGATHPTTNNAAQDANVDAATIRIPMPGTIH